jgi:hypothetical protein
VQSVAQDAGEIETADVARVGAAAHGAGRVNDKGGVAAAIVSSIGLVDEDGGGDMEGTQDARGVKVGGVRGDAALPGTRFAVVAEDNGRVKTAVVACAG